MKSVKSRSSSTERPRSRKSTSKKLQQSSPPSSPTATSSSSFDGDEQPIITPEELPLDICNAAARNNIGLVMSWIMGQSWEEERLAQSKAPSTIFAVAKKKDAALFQTVLSRINARCREKMGRTLLHEASNRNHVTLTRLLLQLGATVDIRSTGTGTTPLISTLQQPRKPRDDDDTKSCDQVVRLLMEWGAKNESRDMNSASWLARHNVLDAELSDLLATNLGGRRCQLRNLQNKPELNGTYGVVVAYLPEKERYRVLLEPSGQRVNIRARNLKRSDRRPGREGYYLHYQHTEDGVGKATEAWGSR